METTVKRIRESVRDIYRQLIKTRNLQLKYVNESRRRKKEFGFIVTPELVLQYNYVHQLMNAFRTGRPEDICEQDGGITCSNLSVLREDGVGGERPERLKSVSASAPAADGDPSDYLASRVVDLLDRSVAIGDQDLTVNVRDEFAANVRTLGMLFEERYRVCREQNDALKSELTTARQRLSASRTVASESAANTAVDRTVRNMREQISRYEAQLRAIRGQVEALRDQNEVSIRRDREQIESLTRRIAEYGRNDAYSEAIVRLVRDLFDSLETERNRVSAAVGQLHSLYVRPEEVSRSTESAESADEMKKRVLAEVTARVTEDLSDRFGQDLERRVEREVNDRLEGEVNNRVSAYESALRSRLEAELKRKSGELDRRFDDEVTAKVAQALGGANAAVQTVVVDQIPGMLRASGADDGAYTEYLRRFKSALDGIFDMANSPLNVATSSQLDSFVTKEAPEPVVEMMGALREYIEKLLDKLRAMYDFMIAQAKYFVELAVAVNHGVGPLDHLSVERAKSLVDQVGKLMATNERSEGSVLNLLEQIRGELAKLKTALETFYRDMDKPDDEKMKQRKQTLERLRAKVSYNRKLTPVERKELETLKAQETVNRATIRELQGSLKAVLESKQYNSPARTVSYSRVVSASEAQAKINYEVSLRNDLLQKFRETYNDLVAYTIDLADEYKRCFREVAPPDQPYPGPLQDYPRRLNGILDEADRVINFGSSPRPAKDQAKSLSGITHGSSKDTRTKGKTHSHASAPAQSIGGSNKRRQKRDRWTESSQRK